MSNLLKVAIVVSHPIQHFCPQYASFAKDKNIQLKVFFASAMGYKKYFDTNFKKEVSWGNLKLDKFEHVFLNGETIIQPDENIDAPGLNKALTAFAPDILISYGYFQRLQRRACKWARQAKVPVAYISDSERRQLRNPLKEMLKYFYLRGYFSRISYFLSVGDANEAFYRHYGVAADKIVRMHFPIDTSQYQPAYEERSLLRKSIREQYGIAENDIVLSVTGKLVPWKNQDHIVSAMQLLEQQRVYIHLFVLGSGEMLEKLRQQAGSLIHSKVYCPGFVQADQLPAFYAATDIYVHPASIEPHSIAVSEAIYMGCPVIISDRCGSYGENDDVQPDSNGYVYPFGNITVLANCIRDLAADTKKRAAFGALSHQLAARFQQSAHVGILAALRNRIKSQQ